jgi:YhcH/YjgK/YiaL family protein
MIVDLLANSHLYRGLNPKIDRSFAFLHETDLAALEPGDYEIDGRGIFARALTYTTRLPDKGVWEAHRLYIDLQVMVQGAERICYAPLSRLTPGTYDEAKDFLRLSGDGDSITLPSGSFMLLWPDDGHMPCLAVDEPEPIKKVVVKITVD